MCEGKIVAPNPEPKEVKKRNNLLKSIKDYFCKIIDSAIDCESVNYPVVSSDLSKVNMCLKCGDLEIDDNWLRIPHPSKPRISEAIKSGSIIINGRLTVCHFCVSTEKEMKRRLKDLYTGQQIKLEIFPVCQ